MAPAQIAAPNGAGAQPRAPQLSDQNLQPFLKDSFDPAEYWNDTLAPLSFTSKPQSSKGVAAPVQLPELSAQTQTVLSQLNAQTTRLSTTLTQLTDEILRCGSRLAYEVEILRGETSSLSETLTERLAEDVRLFVPDGLSVDSNPTARQGSVTTVANATEGDTNSGQNEVDDPTQPAYMANLRTLSLVKSRLDAVVQVFGHAMEWTLPPSELSLGSSFISVSGPEPDPEHHSREEKGQEVAKKLRDEIKDILYANVDGEDALEAAIKRVGALRELVQVWKGTVEEKPRLKFLESLIRLIEERQKELEKEATRRQTSGRSSKGDSHRETPQRAARDPLSNEQVQTQRGGYSLMDHLQKMRGGL
jgi:hypothetical protein